MDFLQAMNHSLPKKKKKKKLKHKGIETSCILQWWINDTMHCSKSIEVYSRVNFKENYFKIKLYQDGRTLRNNVECIKRIITVLQSYKSTLLKGVGGEKC